MEDGAVVAIVLVACTFLYATARLIFRSGGAPVAKDKNQGTDSRATNRELFDLAMRLQNRVETLERLLDQSQPEWRGKP